MAEIFYDIARSAGRTTRKAYQKLADKDELYTSNYNFLQHRKFNVCLVDLEKHSSLKLRNITHSAYSELVNKVKDLNRKDREEALNGLKKLASTPTDGGLGKCCLGLLYANNYIEIEAETEKEKYNIIKSLLSACAYYGHGIAYYKLGLLYDRGCLGIKGSLQNHNVASTLYNLAIIATKHSDPLLTTEEDIYLRDLATQALNNLEPRNWMKAAILLTSQRAMLTLSPQHPFKNSFQALIPNIIRLADGTPT